MEGFTAKTLTLKQVAALIPCSRRTVYRLVEKGYLIAPINVGGVPRWYPQDVETYLWRKARRDLKDDEGTDEGDEKEKRGSK